MMYGPSRITSKKPFETHELRNQIQKYLVDKPYILSSKIHINRINVAWKKVIKVTVELYLNEPEYVAELLTSNDLSVVDRIRESLKERNDIELTFNMKY